MQQFSCLNGHAGLAITFSTKGTAGVCVMFICSNKLQAHNCLSFQVSCRLLRKLSLHLTQMTSSSASNTRLCLEMMQTALCLEKYACDSREELKVKAVCSY